MKNKEKFFVPIIAAALLVPVMVFGATMKAGEEISLQKRESIQDNVYVAGGSVSVGSAVFGDLFAAGGNVTVLGDVSKDIAAAGGTVTILGNGGDDVRVAGGNILITGNVAGEVIATGGSVVISEGVTVGKDLVVAGGQISVEGDVLGNMQIAGGAVTINGHIKGNVKATVDSKLTLGSGAIIDGSLEYGARTKDALKVNDGAVVAGGTVFKEITTSKQARDAKNVMGAIAGAFTVFKLIVLLVTALLLVWLFKNFSQEVVVGAVRSPLRMLGKGFVALVIIPVASILLLVTLIGAPLGIMALFTYVVLLLLSGVYAGVVLGGWATAMVIKNEPVTVMWKSVTIGVVLLTVVKLIPLVGWVVGLCVFLITLGSIVDIMQKKLWEER